MYNKLYKRNTHGSGVFLQIR